jgi:acetate kinase
VDSRAEIVGALAGLGVVLDADANQLKRKDPGPFETETVRWISGNGSGIAVYVVPAEEDLMIARHVAEMCGVSLPCEDESR